MASFTSFAGLLEVHELISQPNAPRIVLSAHLATSVDGDNLTEIDSPPQLLVAFDYFNNKREQYFRVYSRFFCDGSITIETSNANDIILTVSAIYAMV
jgi:hypothetical protein